MAAAPLPARMRHGALILTLMALIALVLTGWRYLTPLSGVTGAGGALLAIVGCAALVVAGLVLAVARPGGVRTLFLGLSWLGLLLTLAAVLFLHGFWSAIALIFAIGALAAETFGVDRPRGAR